ncbi:hypothetical protein [Agromyces sp. Marseille-P2726]|uniref:hypothetical protein n=1 Tax=Agromyces sp. Marseille-P2726 TaxID=2709132 RepID=UPI00156FEFAC|nr:hypothetical protein [Agromyces sp. Marseille-P2726]
MSETGEEIRTTPARRGLFFGLGAALTLVGLIGVAIYAFMPRNTPAEGEGTADGLLQSGLIIGSAVLTGIGVLLLVWGFVMSTRARREAG